MDQPSGEELARTDVINGKNVPGRIIIPKGVDPDEFMRRRNQSALGNITVDEASGTATVNCPYCVLYYRKANPIDVTFFIEQGGNKEHTVRCSEGHKVKFKSIPQWREERQRLGLQVKS